MKKIWLLWLVLTYILVFWFSTTHAVDNSSTLYTLLDWQKTSILNYFNQTSNNVYDKYNKIWKPVVDTIVYKSLICLWAITTPFDVTVIDTAKETLRKNILEDYISLDGKVKRFELWLLSDFTWLRNEILAFSGEYIPQINQFQTNQLQLISWLIQTVKDYTSQNSEIINKISANIIKIQWPIDLFNDMNSDIEDFESSLNGSQKDFYNKLNNTKIVSANLFNSNLQNLTDKFVKRYKKLPWLQDYLLWQKDFHVNKFNDYAQSEINKLFWVTYNQEKYTQISNSVQELKSQFYNWDNINCTKILNNYSDIVDRKISNITNDILLFNSWLNISNVSISSWLSISSQNSALSAIKSLYIQYLNLNLQNFREFVYQTIDELYQKYIAKNS